MARQGVNAAVFLLLAGSLVIPRPACAQPPVEKIVSFWNERQHDVDGITYRVEGDVFSPQGYITHKEEVQGEIVTLDYPPHDHSYQTRAEIRIDLKDGRAFRRVIEERYNPLDPTRQDEMTIFPVDETYLFNGELFKRYTPMSTNHPHGHSAKWKLYAELGIFDVQRELLFRAEHVPLLLSLGFVRVNPGYDPTSLRTELNARDFKQVSESTIDGKRCAVLQTAVKRRYFHEYVVEVAEPHLVRETKTFDEDGKLFESTSIDYQPTDAGYLPETWQTTKFSFENGKAETFDMRLTDFEIDPTFTNDDFDVDPPHGTRVADATRPRQSMTYVVGDEEVPELPVAEYEMQQEARAARNWMYLIVAAVAVVLIGGAVWYRRARA